MTYYRPSELAGALDVAARPEIRVLGGGTDIFPATQTRELAGEILDLTGIAALRGIARVGDLWRIGATTRWSDIVRADLPEGFRALQQAAREVGSVQIQNSGTIAGNLCNASPAADGMPALLVLDASVEVASRNGLRSVLLADFVTGIRKTCLRPGEIVTAITIPSQAVAGRSVFAKFGARKYLVISIASVAVRLVLNGDRIEDARVAVGACSPVAKRLTGFEGVLRGKTAKTPEAWTDSLIEDIERHLSPIDDIRADAASRKSAVAELVLRAIRDLARGKE